MKLFFKTSAFVLLAISMVALSSCSKYEEGSKFTLLSKKARVVGDWTLTDLSVNGISQNLSSLSIEPTFKKDDTYTITTTVTILGVTVPSTETGTWKFSSDKLDLVRTDSNSNVTSSEIVRLASKEMKLKEVEGATTTIWTFEAK